MSTIGTQKVSRLRVSVGLTGTWRGEVWCDEGAATIGKATLTVGDLSFVGSTVRGGTDAPDAPHLIHTGAPGWEREVDKPISYEQPQGVRLSSVLRDLAGKARANEPIEQPGDVNLGPMWSCMTSRVGEPLRYRDALAALVKARYLAPWRVDPDGVTRFGSRILPAVDVRKVNVIRRDAGAGLAVVGSDAFAALLPGATFEGAVIERLDITERPGNLQAEVYTIAPGPLALIVRKVGERFPQLIYGGPRTYRVSATHSDGHLDLEPPTDAAHLPRLAKVEAWTLGGARVTPLVGSLAVVLFRDSNPGRPCVVGLEPLAKSKPTKIEIDADEIDMGDAVAPVIRATDKIAIDVTPGPTLGTISFIGTSIASHSKVKA